MTVTLMAPLQLPAHRIRIQTFAVILMMTMMRLMVLAIKLMLTQKMGMVMRVRVHRKCRTPIVAAQNRARKGHAPS